MAVRVALAGLAIALLWSGPSFAQAGNSSNGSSANAGQQVVTQFTPDQVAGILRDAGYRAEIVHENEKYHILTGMGGYKVVLYLYCNNGQCTSLDWDVSFTAAPKYTLTLVNKWNREKRYAKAYIANDGAFYLEYSLDFAGGVTKQTLASSASLFDSFVNGLDGWINSASSQ